MKEHSLPGAPEPCFAPGRQIIASPGALEAIFAPGRRWERGFRIKPGMTIRGPEGI